MTPVEPTGPEEGDAVERTLGEGLGRPPLSDEAYARIHAAVATEWRTAVRLRSSWRSPRRWAVAAAAGLAAAILVAAMSVRGPGKAPIFAVVARVEKGALILRHGLLSDDQLEVHSTLHTGDVLIARGAVLVELHGGGTVRIAPGTRLEVTSADGLSLDAGEVYLDFPPDLHRETTFVVRTPLGLVEHLGTQFDVAVANGLRIRVREGRVRLRRDSQTETAGVGTELVVSRAGRTSQRTIATHGSQWSWVEALEPDYPIEDRKLSDFLHWAARESGGQLHFRDDHAREVAERTRLHGSISGLSVSEALETVFATTSLRYNFEQDRIEVSSGG